MPTIKIFPQCQLLFLQDANDIAFLERLALDVDNIATRVRHHSLELVFINIR